MADPQQAEPAASQPPSDPQPGPLPDRADKPLDVDGVNAAKMGTAGFAVGFSVLLIFVGPLKSNDALWWLWVAGIGVALGAVGIWYTSRRRAAYRAAGRHTH